MTYPIKPVDTVRKPGDMLPADLEGVEGRWLDVPRLQQKNPDENQSNYWCGRTSASMVVSYYAKFAGKDDEQIGHNDGPQGIGSNGQKKNIRWLGGSMKDKLAGVNEQGKCWPIGAFKAMNWGTDSGELCNEKNYASLRPTDESFVQETFKRHLEQLKKNNPVVQYTQLTDNRGHIVCIVGYKKDAQGRLWLRVNDPCYVHKKLIGPGNYQMIKEPSSASSYSEYWIRAGRLLETYPGRSTPLFAHGDAKGGTFQYAIPDKPVPDDHELVHLIKQGQAADVGATNPTTSTPPAGGDSPAPSTPAATTPAATTPAGGDAPKDGPVTAKPPPADDSATKGPDEADIEADVIAGAYKDRGAYTSGTGFNDKALNKLLAKYCKDDGLDPKAQSKGGSSSGGGGDLEASTTADIPLWLEKWRQTVSNSGAWGKKEQGRSRLAEAFYRKFFRDKISAAGLKYPPVADEFFAQLFKSNMNKQCKDLGGPGSGYCAAASSVALQRELQARGYQMVPHKKWGGTVVGKDALPDLAGSKFASTKPQPGDILSLVTSGTPRTGHVVTVLLPMGENFVDGAIWVVSGNTGPGNGTIAVDIIHPAAKPASFNPLDGKSWDQSGDTKPPAGKAWIYAVQLGGNVVPDLVDAMSDDDKKANFVTSAPAKPTPGSQAAPDIQHPWPEGGGDAPAPSTPGAPATPSTPGAPATPSSGGTKPGGAQAGGDTPAAPKKEDPGAAPQPAANPPMSGNTRMPFDLNGSSTVTGEDITALYHQSERGLGGFFPLGDTGIFHCGAHFTPSAGSKLYAIADGEVVAFRNGTTPGEHPWGDTGFVILRHPVKDNKLVYSMFVHLKKEPLHPDRTNAPWLSQVLKDAMQDKDKKPSWRITTAMPTWKDEDKGKFSPTNVQNDKLLDPGVYEEEEELVQDEKRFIKVKDKNVWVKVTDADKAKELSPWHDFDIDKAAKNSANVKALVDGKTAVFDSEKGEDKKHKVKVSAGECVGLSGNYLEGATVHWSVFTKDDIFPSGSLPDEEYTSADPVKVQALDLSGKDAGTKEQTKAFLDVLDKDKKFLGTKEDASIMEPGELRGFYRTPTHGWKTRYLSVKGIADFKLDADKFVKQDRYKSHTEKEKKEFVDNSKLFRFWDDLSSAEDFPTDGNAHWVHPATALRLMSTVSVKQDHDDPSIGTDASDPDHLHPGQDITIIVADAKGPLAGVNVTVRADGNQIAQAMTDSSGEILVRLEDAAGKTIEVEVAKDAMDGGQLYNTVNETGSPQGLMPGSSVGQQTTNGTDVVPAPRLGLRVKTTGNIPTQADWDDELHKPKGAKGPDIGKDEFIDIERFVFRREDGKFEGAEASYKGQICYFWTIYDGAGAITPAPRDEHGGDSKDPLIVGSWSDRIAHLTDHPVFSGRALNIADGTELEVTWVVMLAQAAPEHDKVLCTDKVKTAAGGFSVAFDPHTLTQDQGFLNTPKPVYPKIKSGDKEFALRGQSVTCYADNKVEDPGPAPVPVKADGPEIVAYTSIDRNGTIDKLTLWDKSAPATKSVHEFAPELAANFICDGNDKIYVGATALELHLATTAEVHMSPAEALEHQKQRTKAIYPDAPDSLWAQGEQLSWHANNGISVGICAFHCKDGVTPGGLKNGCNESIRQNNIGSCHNASYTPCKTAVQLGTPSNKVKSCGGALGACGTAGHDKSHCFMAEPVTGDNAEERERWYVALPMRISGNGYPYKHSGRDKQLNVLLINPKNGKMVVCSQEDRGPSATCTSNAAYPTANVKADEFKGKGRIVGPSYEVAWKLDLPKLGYDPVVMVAFVANSVPLGPVAPGTKIRLKEKATLVELLGAYAAT